ncbi:hypothetical protein Tco_0512025, partial [Tanacetum coccineum]
IVAPPCSKEGIHGSRASPSKVFLAILATSKHKTTRATKHNIYTCASEKWVSLPFGILETWRCPNVDNEHLNGFWKKYTLLGLIWRRNGQDYDSSPNPLKKSCIQSVETASRSRISSAPPSEIEEPYEPSPRTNNKDLECEIVMVKMPKCMSWLAYDEPIGDLGSSLTYKNDIQGVSYVDDCEPPLPNLPFLDVNLGDKRGTGPPINSYSPGSFRMKVIFDKEKPGSS